MRVLGACSLGGAGHLQPLVPLLAAARQLGHEVAVVAPPAMAAMVVDAGFEWAGGGEPDEDEVRPIRERLPLAPQAEASMLGERELFGRLAAGAMLPAMRAACDRWPPDLVLRETCEHASTVVAAERGLRVAQVGISVAAGEWTAIGLSAPSVAEHHADAPALNRSMPYLTRFPASTDPSEFPTTIRYHVPLAPAAPLPDWWAGSAAPLVYVTFGTVLGYMSFAAEVYRLVLDAVADLEANVLLTVGRRFDPAQLGEVPAHVHVEPWVDQADVLAQADLVVAHGGSGTVYGALGAGVPLVCVPVFADQFTNARIVADAGAGLAVSVPGVAGAARTVIGHDQRDSITAAIHAVLADRSFAAGAQRIASEMSATPTAEAVMADLLASTS